MNGRALGVICFAFEIVVHCCLFRMRGTVESFEFFEWGCGLTLSVLGLSSMCERFCGSFG